MKKIIFIFFVIGVTYWWQHREPETIRVTAHDQVIMYSSTTCGFCKAKGRELRQAGIPFIEYYIDKDTKRRDELNEKLKQSGLPPRRYGTPILDVKGYMMPGNPKLEKIQEQIDAA